MANTKPIGVAFEDQNIIGADDVQATLIYAKGQIGYDTGVAGSVTQSNNKNTAVTLNTPAGQITTANSQLAPSANASFTVNCSSASALDTVIVGIASGGTLGAYSVTIGSISNGSFVIVIKNITNNAYSEVLVINYAILHVRS